MYLTVPELHDEERRLDIMFSHIKQFFISLRKDPKVSMVTFVYNYD